MTNSADTWQKAEEFTQDFLDKRFPKTEPFTASVQAIGDSLSILSGVLQGAVNTGVALGSPSPQQIADIFKSASPVYSILAEIGLATKIAADIGEIVHAQLNGDSEAVEQLSTQLMLKLAIVTVAAFFGYEVVILAVVYTVADFVLDQIFTHLQDISDFANNLLNLFSDLVTAALDPLVLDLNGDGIHLKDEAHGVHFDFSGDHFAELTGWVGPDDGFLVLDKNGNGKIDNISEMFGNPIWDPKESIHTGNATIDGFAALAVYDTNQDGKIDASDPQFAQLQVWQDLNQNGVTDPGEIKTLTELGILSISLQATATDVGATGNESSDLGTVTQIGNVITLHPLSPMWMAQ
jgi:hypothetical protein